MQDHKPDLLLSFDTARMKFGDAAQELNDRQYLECVSLAHMQQLHWDANVHTVPLLQPPHIVLEEDTMCVQ